MPIFEYLCDDCGSKFEKLILRQNTDPENNAPIECPSCGKTKVTQQISMFRSRTDGGTKPPMGHSKEHDTYSYGHDD